MRDCSVTLSDMIANPVVHPVNMFHSQLMFRVLGDLDHGLIINKERRGLKHIVTEIFK